MKNDRTHEEMLSYVGSAGMQQIWTQLRPAQTRIDVREEIERLEELFIYLFKKNIFVEYKQGVGAIFSGRAAEEVVGDIFADFPYDDFPATNPGQVGDFWMHLLLRMKGWAYLREGTTLALPD